MTPESLPFKKKIGIYQRRTPPTNHQMYHEKESEDSSESSRTLSDKYDKKDNIAPKKRNKKVMKDILMI